MSMEITEKVLPDILVTGYRFKGRYDQVGIGIGKIFKAYGRFCAGAPMVLYYDTTMKDNDADMEVCLPLKNDVPASEGFTVRTLPGGKVVSLIHKGGYDSIGTSYQYLTDAIAERKLTAQTPCREVYLKGPGMIFRGNPKNYRTEILLPVV